MQHAKIWRGIAMAGWAGLCVGAACAILGNGRSQTWSEMLEPLREWQTLLTGILAVTVAAAGAIIAWFAARSQIKEMKRQNAANRQERIVSVMVRLEGALRTLKIDINIRTFPRRVSPALPGLINYVSGSNHSAKISDAALLALHADIGIAPIGVVKAFLELCSSVDQVNTGASLDSEEGQSNLRSASLAIARCRKARKEGLWE